MGKSSHKSKKKRRSPSRDRLASLEDKLARLVDVLEQREVRASRQFSPASSVDSVDHQASQESQLEVISDSVDIPETHSNENDLVNETNMAAPARQERPSVQRDTGVYDFPETIFVEYRRQVDTAFPNARINFVRFPGVTVKGNVTFQSPPGTEDMSVNNAVTPSPEDKLTQELFASDLEKVEVLPWNDLVSNKWRDLTRKGLPAEQRDPLLSKYSPPDALAFLRAPALNPEVKSALRFNSIIKRDDFNGKDQAQVGTALCALGEAISELLKPEIQRSLIPEARAAVVKINEGANILADLFFRLSLSRRAQIMPSLNQLAKTTANAISSDDLLFGTLFGEELKKAATLEKSVKDIVRTPLAVSRKTVQPSKLQGASSAVLPG